MSDNQTKRTAAALLADDVPNAKTKVIWLVAIEAVITLAIVALMFLTGKQGWGIAAYISLFVGWIVNDVVFWQLWKSVAYRLTVTERQIVLQLFFHSKKMALSDVETYRCAPAEGKFVRFCVTGKGKTLQFDTQYPQEMLVILTGQTGAVNADEQPAADGEAQGKPKDAD